MPRKGKAKATRAREKKEQMRKKRQADASMGLASLPEEKPLARAMASPSLTSEKNCPASMGMAPRDEEKPLARSMASPSSASEKNCPTALSFLSSFEGSLSIPHEDMAPTSDSPSGVCTPPRVPSPRLLHQGVAGQTKLVEVTRIIKSNFEKMCQIIQANKNTIIQANDRTDIIYEPDTASDIVHEAETSPDTTSECLIDVKLDTCHQLESMPTSEKLTSNAAAIKCGNEVCDILPYSSFEQTIVRGSFHQGSLRFGINAGKQCVANCLVALVESKLSQVNHWNSSMLDTILAQGNNLYTWIHGNNDLLLLSDLPSEIEINNMYVNIEMKDSIASFINMNENLDLPGVLPLDQAIQESLIETDGCFICVQGSTCLVIKQANRFFLFDSHSRDEQGLPAYNGSSIVMTFESFEHLYQHLIRLVRHNYSVQFEITGVIGTIQDFEACGEAILNVDVESQSVDGDEKEYQNVSNEASLQQDCRIQSSGDSMNESIPESKNMKRKDPTIDVQFITTDNVQNFDFKPVQIPLRRKLCCILNIPSGNVTKSGNYKSVTNMGKPDKTQSIVGDGNCLFRALSFAISQRQKFHFKLREAIVMHCLENVEKFSSFTNSTLEEHILSNRMKDTESWGTSVEILAAADLLKTDVYTFTDNRWIRYSAQQIDRDCDVNKEAIYLKHENNHYEVVTSVLGKSSERCLSRKRKTSLTDCVLDSDDDNLYSIQIKKSKKEKMRESYQTTRELRERKRKISKERYATDFSFREAIKRKVSDLYQTDQRYRNQKKEASVNKYCTDDTFRETVKDASINKYASDETFRETVKDASINKYASDETFHETVKDASINKYASDEAFRETVKDASINKYASDETFRETVKDASINKYASDETFRETVKDASINKYASDETFRETVKDASINKYATDETFRQRVLDTSSQKYASHEAHRNNKIVIQTKARRQNDKEERSVIENVIQKFKLESKKGPEFVCGCCFRLFFMKQVLEYDHKLYNNRGNDVAELSKKCISDKYVHKCNSYCVSQSQCAISSRRSLWVCLTCHRKILAGTMPAESHANGLNLDDVPTELKSLNSLEQHLIALNIPFMKILGLPKGGQKGVHGPVVCVPSDLQKITSTLPRSEDENRMLAVKLKRKIEYKGYEEYQYISTRKLETAINYLKEKNTWFSDVHVNENWLNPIPEEQEINIVEQKIDESEIQNERDKNMNTRDNVEESNHIEESNEEESYIDDKLRGVQLSSCLQPADIGQEVLDQCFDEVFNISPAEGNKPVSVLQDEGVEAKSFPVHFPNGKNTFKHERDERLSLLRYFNMRLMGVDNRFAKDTSYIFFAQYLSELDQVKSKLQISLRKQSPLTSDGQKITSNMLANKDFLTEMMKKDEAIKYLKPIRGTPPYWQAAQKDMFAMVRQLGKPTFFCSFSSADFRWNEMLETVMKQQGDTRNVENLGWKEKCDILYSNPVTLARMFDHRFQTFLKEVILSDAHPIGKVKDHFYRIEFQQRGSPHAHCLFWIEDAPVFGIDNTSDIVDFIDRYITCRIPNVDEDPELNEMVTSLHKHSKNHSKSCKKKGTNCRFNFPRPPSTQTFIAEKNESDTTKEEIEQAKQRLNQLWECVLSQEFESCSVEEIFEKVNMTQQEFESICSLVANRDTVILKREADEIYINQYNEHLLRAWNANMDIQYVLDEYSCIVYIISYISKAERELGLLLQQTRVEAAEGNLNAQQTMKKVGTAYLHHREVSAQEAIYRVTGMNLKGCSRKVEFVPLGLNPCRLSIPLKDLKKATKNSETENNESNDETIWMANIVDRYKARPMNETFEEMSLAQFCSEYSVLASSQIPKKINKETTFKLGKDLGYIRKRTRTDPAVIRYPRFSMESAPEKYFQSMLQLFLPHRSEEQLKPKQFETYEDFYKTGSVKLSNTRCLATVQSIVEGTKENFVKVGDQVLEEAEKALEQRGYQEDAWAQLCPQTEAQRLECEEEGTVSTTVEDNSDESIPDLNSNNTQAGTNLLTTTLFPRNEMIPLLQNMNCKQREVFYKIRQWCLQKANGETVEPFHVFITGGGGTGKSHLIKCLHYEMTRILSKIIDNPDDISVLLTAPTGTAAFNISGITIHSALGIYKNLSLDHAILSEDKINTLRSKLESLQVIIIDEISMVNKRLLFFIHERLRQIKKMPEDSLFGGVSVIAVGDFYQLPPVKTKKSDKLYVDDPANPMNQLWNELFEIVELDEIMRQKNNSEFAEILNRVRVRTKSNELEKEDLSVLKSRIQEGPENALHICATNDEIKTHNNRMVMKLGSEVKLLEAEDYQKSKVSGQSVRKSMNFTEKDLQLPSSLLLGVGARVMLIKNIDTKDGLVNGVIGTVMEISQKTSNTLPQKIFVHFDNEKVGKQTAEQKTINGKRCIAIPPSIEDVPRRNGSRKQFPLQLAWACTVHKVQGLTVTECVIDLSKCFSCGQAYVALSRVTSLSGLYIKDIEEKVLESKIYCDPDVEAGLKKMKTFLEENEDRSGDNGLSFLYHNIEGLENRIEDLRRNPEITNVDFICLTETWLQNEAQRCRLDKFILEHISRMEAYTANTDLYASLKNMHHGGVGVFFQEGLMTTRIKSFQNLECVIFKIPGLEIVVVTVYRTQKYPLNLFLDNFKQLMYTLLSLTEKIIVLGDFNQNILRGETSVLQFMESTGFRQCVTTPTTEGGTLIDHVYVRGIDDVEVTVLPTYYSYHEAILVKVKYC